MCVCVCVCLQKRKSRAKSLKKIGGAAQLISNAKSRGAAWAANGLKLVQQIDFLTSPDANEFQSDDEDEQDAQTQTVVRARRQHTFRSQLASDIAHELDKGRTPLRQSTRDGCVLSAGKAGILLQPHYSIYAPLFHADTVAAIAVTNKRKAVEELGHFKENGTVSHGRRLSAA